MTSNITSSGSVTHHKPISLIKQYSVYGPIFKMPKIIHHISPSIKKIGNVTAKNNAFCHSRLFSGSNFILLSQR